MKILDKIKKIKITTKQQKTIYLVSIFIMMLILNFLTPLIADDYSYSFTLKKERITNIFDIIINQANHYMLWGGRSIAHTIGNFFLMYPKTIFNILNSFMYVLLVYLIYQHAKSKDKDKPIMIVLINLLIWFLLPAFGQNCIWLIGSCNYLWTTVIILAFLLNYRKSKEKIDSNFRIIGILILGIIAGWTNENTAFGLIVITLGLMMVDKLNNKKFKFHKWQISGLIGTILGFIILIAAPGNYIRNEAWADNTFILLKLMRRIITITDCLLTYLLPLIIIMIIIITIHIYRRKKINSEVMVFAIGSIFSAYAMCLSPIFPERAWFGVIIFMIISVVNLIYSLENIHKIYKYIIIDLVVILSIIMCDQYIEAAKDINSLRLTWEYRESVIEKAKSQGKTRVKLGKYETFNSKNPAYGLGDIQNDGNDWPNTDIAKYYKIKKIEKNN